MSQCVPVCWCMLRPSTHGPGSCFRMQPSHQEMMQLNPNAENTSHSITTRDQTGCGCAVCQSAPVEWSRMQDAGLLSLAMLGCLNQPCQVDNCGSPSLSLSGTNQWSRGAAGQSPSSPNYENSLHSLVSLPAPPLFPSPTP